MPLTTIDLSGFPKDREEGLRKLHRYSMFEVTFYRSNLWQHSHRVHWIVEELLPLTDGVLRIDKEKARVLALVHDDAEMITGDIQAGLKAKMTPGELAALDADEEKAAHELAAKYPKSIHGYDYESLLIDIVRKDCIEAQLVAYADKFDAYCESLHEVLAGNLSLIWSVMFYEHWFPTYATKYPALAPLTHIKSPFVVTGDNRFQPAKVLAKNYDWLGKPHSEESIKYPTEFGFYDAWREMVQRRGGEEGKQWLLEQKEFLPSA